MQANAGTWTDGGGCLSDHAQVSAEVGLVPILHKAHYNPLKRHRFTYRLAHVWETNGTDHGNTVSGAMDERSARVFGFDQAYPGSFYLMHQASDSGRILLGTVDPSRDDPQGICRIGCVGIQTIGNEGESDAGLVQTSRNLFLEEVD